MSYNRSRRSLLKILLGSPFAFLIPAKQAFHFQYRLSLPENLSQSPYLSRQKIINEKKIQIINRLLINEKHISKVSEHRWSSRKMSVNFIFKSKNSFNLWHSIMAETIFNQTHLNKFGFKIDFYTKNT